MTTSINTQVRDYTFSTNLTGTLDQMTGATTLVASNIDDTPSAVQSIGFTFRFDGVDYTQYSVSPDGWLLLGGTTPSSQFSNIITSTTNIPKLYPYWDDLATGTDGNVTAVVTGTAPNRILKVQWNVTIPRNTSGPANSLFQAWLYEGSNVVEFRYGVMGSGTMSASVGLTGNNPTSNFNSVTISTNTASNTVANDNNTTQPEPGRLYRFTPFTITSYAWNPAGDVNNPAIPNPTAFLAATTTTFTVTVTASNGCSSTGNVTVTVNSTPDINFTYTENSGTPNDGAICPGASVTITASGGTSYSWSDGLGSNPSVTVSPTSTTIYNVSVTDANGCSNSATVAVTVNPIPILSATLFFPSSCTVNDGSINLTVSGVTPQSYNWTGPNGYTNNVEDISGLFAGLYNVTVTSTQGCTNVTSYNIDLIPSCSACPVLNTLTASPNPVCANANVNLNATGLVGLGVTYGIVFKSFTSPTATPYTGGTVLGTVPNANLTSGGTAASLTTNFATAGTYYLYAILTPTPTDLSCRPFATTTLVVNALPNASTTVAENSGTTPNDGIICAGATATITASGGTSYLWSPGGATTASIVVTPATTTTYTVTVTNASSCTAVTTRTITVNPLPTAATTVSENSGGAANDGIICAGASVTITASGGTSYLWSPGGATTAAITVSPTTNTTYSVTVTNANGCSAVTTRTITVNPNPVVTTTVAETSGVAPNDGIICAGSSVTITATGGPSYLWTPGNATTAAITVTPATTTTYTVNVTNANGCATSATRTITVNPLPVITFTSSNAAMCVGDTRQITASPVNGTFTVTGPATIVNGLLTATGVGTAVISYSVTDANGCFGSGTQSIVINATPVITTQPVDAASCEGGSVTFSVVATLSQGTLQYQWQRLDGNTWVNIAGATGATYTVNNVNAANNNQRYRVIVRNSLNTNCQVISNVAILGVHIPGAMTCNNHVNVSLDQNCGFSAFSDFFIEGPNSEMFYQVTLRAPNGQVVPQSQVRNYLNQILTVEVRDICSGNYCWGTVKFEDKTPPVLNCPCTAGVPNVSAFREIARTNQKIYYRSNASFSWQNAYAHSLTVGGGAHMVSINSAAENALIKTGMDANFAAGWRVWIGLTDSPLYGGTQAGNNPNTGWVWVNGDPLTYTNWAAGEPNGLANEDYVEMFATGMWNDNTNTAFIQPYILEVDNCSYTCADLPRILGSTQITNNPNLATADACGPVTSTFVDNVEGNDCTGRIVRRSWLVTDGSGNTAQCEQIFSLRKLNISDVLDPVNVVDLECKDATDPESVAAKLGVRFGYPTVLVGGQPAKIDNNICGLYAVYSDVEVDACGTHCHGNRKVIRTWSLVDWCTAQVVTRGQVLKAVDDDAPTAILKDTTVSTRPWDCTADFFVPNPWELHDNCDINPEWTVKGPVGVQIVPAVQVVNGQVQPHPVYKWRAVGAPKGVHTFRYTLVDCCGNERVLTNTITVVDKTPPTPIAKRDIVIGLVPGFDADGFPDGQAKLFAKDVDNGSHDNCTEVRIDIRRPKGPDCGNEGLITNPATGARHNNNLTFSNRVNMPNYSPNDTDGGEFVKFCCADLEALDVDANGDGVIDELDRGYVEVIIRVWDDGNMNGIIGDAGDNWNETWAFVKVEQKVPPVITCPPDATIHCDWAIQTSTTDRPVTGIDFTKTGLPTAYGVCRNPEIRFRDVLQLNQCGIGTITRTFTVVENNVSRQCQQRITVLPSTSQQQWVVTPPSASVPEVGCDGPTEAQIKANQPTWVNGPCDVIGISTKKWEFEFEDGVCKKWVVEYKLVNWCTNEERGPYTKMFVYKDVVPPTFENCRDTMFGVDANCEIRFLTLTKRASDTGGCTENGWIKWQIFVDLWADGTDDYEWSSFLPVGNDVNNANTGNFQAIQDNNGNGIKDIYVAPTSNGGMVTIRIPEPIVGKMSNHKITWKATDGCHNHVTCHEQFMVVDKKPPTPVCVPLSSALMADPDGSGPMRPMVELWAIDFNVKSFDNCTDEEDLLFTFDNTAPQVTDKVVFNRLINIDIPHYFDKTGGLLRFPADMTNAQQRAIVEKYMRGEENTAGNGVIQLWNPAQRSSAKVWTDRELAPNSNKGEVNVMMSVWDKKFNVDFCWTNLQLICNTCNNNPGGSRMIAGAIRTETGQNVSNTAVTFSVFHPEYPKTVMTGSNGQYSLMLESGMDVNIGASKNNDFLNGVSTLDLVLIQRHILGLQELDSPYKLIAADATNDGKVTAADITEIRKVILGVTTAYAANTSWRFPIAAQQMSQDNPWPFVENIVIENIQTDMTNQNFVAVKVGDVNGSAAANVSDPALESRSAKVVRFTAEDRNVAAGERVAVAISGADFADVYGYQFTMNLNGASFAEIVPGAVDMTANNIGVLASDVVTMSYASRNGVTVSDDETLFTVVLKAEKSGRLSEMMSIGSAVTKAEAYTGADLQVSNVTLSMRTKEVTADVAELFQNEPNPFRGATTVSYYLPEASDAVITVFDVTGRVVLVRKASANKGMNSEVFTKEQLGAAGVLYYRLDSGDFTATKKMIVIE
ncbi:MAG: T9SS type A sorting domain-containing protein [Saprospiraceae bacterium]|nr:T9SS type A sorting domain-containing protein [Saprospiraceae bacterium]